MPGGPWVVPEGPGGARGAPGGSWGGPGRSREDPWEVPGGPGPIRERILGRPREVRGLSHCTGAVFREGRACFVGAAR